MKRSTQIIVDILIAIAISLVVNFSHFMLIFIDQDSSSSQSTSQLLESSNTNELRVEGIFTRDQNGHGFIKYGANDSAYVSYGKVNRYQLSTGDTLISTIMVVPQESNRDNIAKIVLRRNGDVAAPYTSNTPQRVSEFISQMLYFFILSFVIIFVATSKLRRKGRKGNFRMLLLAIFIAALLYLFAPLTSHRHQGDIILDLLLDNKSIFEYMLVLKWSFALIVSLLYSQIFTLMSQQQNILLENEQLRSESLNAQYNMLMSQINPHVFFNSLNSLAMLVREKDEERSLTYIDQLSYTFRYILQNRDSTLTTLAEEMRFIDAYIYLFKIRYADKLFFDVDIDPKYNDYLIPALSLEPLVDNAVKHNTILSSRPFHVSINVQDGVLVVSNHKYPKLEAAPSTGVGLENLSRRWELIAHRPIEVVQSDDLFVVRLPLLRPQERV